MVVEAEVQYDAESGRSLGWGTVEFNEAEDAVDAAVPGSASTEVRWSRAVWDVHGGAAW